MCADQDDAERLTQDVFVRVWQRLGSFRGDSRFTSWLHRIAVNLVLEDSRSMRRRTARVQNVADPAFHERPGKDASSDYDARMDLERAIATLPPGARHALVLHDIEGYKHEEIAQMLGIATGTVKAQLHRARRLMRARLGE